MWDDGSATPEPCLDRFDLVTKVPIAALQSKSSTYRCAGLSLCRPITSLVDLAGAHGLNDVLVGPTNCLHHASSDTQHGFASVHSHAACLLYLQWQALGATSAGMGFFAALYAFASWVDKPSKIPFVSLRVGNLTCWLFH